VVGINVLYIHAGPMR